jgi:hypothetical protein
MDYQVKDVSEPENNNLIERLNGTVRERTKVMRGMKTVESSGAILDGWVVHYNHFRPHMGLKNQTPAQAALAEIPLKQWDDVARLDVRPFSRKRVSLEKLEPKERQLRPPKPQEPKRRRDPFGVTRKNRLLGAPPNRGFLGDYSRRKRLFT